ncbi:MBL fold metallo-hydrolase [Kordiimonas aquimaris]|uniref:MBL fold metallo-hydrolase n=1 Tax=Kordiimonas aquimaris TaxID=707591 RepID=UPI0021D0A4D2|nr:MBL fold metallo-hydrolase [Kordiimonas aquimaris]
MIINKLLMGAACGLLSASISLSANAGQTEDALIAKIVAAYGGDALINAKALRIQNSNRIISVGQSANPEVTDIAINKSDLFVDFANRRSSLENWNENRGGTFLNQAVFDGTSGHAYNHLAKTRSENAGLTFFSVGGGTMRTTDTTLVRILLENRDAAVKGDDVVLTGNVHETLTFPMEGSPDLTIYVNKETGLLTKMRRENPVAGALDYVFSAYKKSDGVTYASQAAFLIAGQPNTLTVHRKLEVNPNLNGVFVAPDGYRDQGANIDTSEMQVRELADGVYYAGQNGGHSIFVDAGDHFIAAGGYAGLTARFDAVKEAAGVDKPLGQQIVTHQHSDHIGGMGEAATLGANFVTVENHVRPVQASLSEPLPDDRITLVDGSMSLANGAVEIYDIATAHADHYLLVYLPELNLVFSADHFSTNLQEGLPTANRNMVTFREAVEALDLDIDGFLGAHGTRQLTMADLRAATEGYTVSVCPVSRVICAD